LRERDDPPACAPGRTEIAAATFGWLAMRAQSDYGDRMVKPVVVTIEHGSSKDAVKAKLDASLGEIRSRLGPLAGSIEQQWVGDALTFRLAALGQPITGRIDVDDRLVRIEVLLPGLLGYLGDRIAGRVQREGAALLDSKN
jgi:hypothetical protein